MLYILIFVIVAYLIHRGNELGKFDSILGKEKDKPVENVAVSGGYFPCILEGNIDMPPMEAVKEAAIIDVKEAGLFKDGMTAEECMALCSMPLPNPYNFGGGGAYGGRYMTGSFRFEIDANGQQTGDSWVKIFSDEKFLVTGGIRQDGIIAMGSIGGTEINGSVATGTLTNGRLLHGDGKHHIYGVLNGTYRKL